ncbi:MAG TPA: response regulator transcription factor [Mucilaginibacter sp.]|nr:response regulator transcription factor [Mucilaginibacter sp.]
MNSGAHIRIAVVDDHPLLREGMVKQFSNDEAFQVIIEAENGLDMLNQLKTVSILPDIAIIDLKMPVMDGFRLSDELKVHYPSILILVVSAYDSDFNKAAMISKGIRGYLKKDCAPSVFREAVTSIFDTGYYYSAFADERTFKTVKNSNIKSLQIPPREMEFLKLCCRTELRYDQIAEKMNISLSTLEGCRDRLFARLTIASRAALVEFALSSGLNDPETEK